MVTSAQNEVFAKDGVVHVICHGEQDEWAVKKTVSQFVILAEELEKKHKVVKCLVDLSDDVGYNIGARDTAMDAMRTKSVPTAIIGISDSTALQTVFNFMVRLAGQGDKFRVFKTSEEARVWLDSVK